MCDLQMPLDDIGRRVGGCGRLAGTQLGCAPARVLGCGGAIAKFWVLDDVEVLTFNALPEYLDKRP
jgi:hypothetical protein